MRFRGASCNGTVFSLVLTIGLPGGSSKVMGNSQAYDLRSDSNSLISLRIVKAPNLRSRAPR
jgi:hypothetical protein